MADRARDRAPTAKTAGLDRSRGAGGCIGGGLNVSVASSVVAAAGGRRGAGAVLDHTAWRQAAKRPFARAIGAFPRRTNPGVQRLRRANAAPVGASQGGDFLQQTRR